MASTSTDQPSETEIYIILTQHQPTRCIEILGTIETLPNLYCTGCTWQTKGPGTDSDHRRHLAAVLKDAYGDGE